MPDDKINLDLIQMVQKARMQHDNVTLPSTVTGVYWIESKAPEGSYPALTPRTGEWRISTTVEAVDALWLKIKAATEAGQLGYKAKVSTKPVEGQTQANERIICVRSYDADDSADLERLRQALLALGLETLYYQRDKID